MPHPARWKFPSPIAAICLAAAACGSSTAAETTRAEGVSIAAARAQQRVQAAVEPIPVEWSSPAVPAGDQERFVVVIPCNQSQPGCTQPVVGAQQALEAWGGGPR